MEELKRGGEPILLQRGHEIEGALIPIELFRERFVDFLGQQALKELMAEMEKLRRKPASSRLSQLDLRELRGRLV
ncbi:MAG: hypothetical protein HY537_02320 [Deltaproteobacteria bacterium]|nr:hypothetical protein [Deltaproteobacteria bacterium]